MNEQTNRVLGSLREPFYDWPGIIHNNWGNRPVIIQSVTHWINQIKRDSKRELRDSLAEYATKRYDVLVHEKNGAETFLAEITRIMNPTNIST